MNDDVLDVFSYALDLMNRPYTLFYGQQVYGEYSKSEMPKVHTFPEGCYMHNSWTNGWYVKLGGGFTPINLSDLPPEVKVNCLLLGINI